MECWSSLSSISLALWGVTALSLSYSRYHFGTTTQNGPLCKLCHRGIKPQIIAIQTARIGSGASRPPPKMVHDSSFILVGTIFDRPPVKQQGYRVIKRLSVILSGVEVCVVRFTERSKPRSAACRHDAGISKRLPIAYHG